MEGIRLLGGEPGPHLAVHLIRGHLDETAEPGVAPGRVELLKDFEQPLVDAESLPGGDFAALLDRLQSGSAGNQ